MMDIPETLRFEFSVLGRDRRLVAMWLILIIGSGAAGALAAVLGGALASLVTESAASVEMVLAAASGVGFLVFASAALRAWGSRSLRTLVEGAVMDRRQRDVDRVILAPESVIDRLSAADVSNKLTDVFLRVTQALQVTYVDLLGTMIAAITALVVVAVISPGLAVIVVAAYLPYLLLRQRLFRRAGARLRDHLMIYPRLLEIIDTAVDSIRQVKQRNAGGLVLDRLRDVHEEYWTATDRHNAVFSKGAALNAGVFALPEAAAYAYLGLDSINGGGSVAPLFTVMLLFPHIRTCIWQVSRIGSIRSEYSMHVHQILELERRLGRDEDAVPVGPSRHARPSVGTHSALLRGRIEVHALRDERLGVRLGAAGLDFAIAPGEHVGIAGRSGAGKSSLLQMLTGLTIASYGSVAVDGVDVPSWDGDALRRQVGYATQRPHIVDDTIKANLCYGIEELPDDAVWSALSDVGLAEHVHSLDGGLRSRVGHGGLSLSGGQAQRLALARLLLRDTRVLLLDEVTSALDQRSELLVMTTLGRFAKGRTMIMVAHRLELLSDFDRILVLEDGAFAEDGTHDELLTKPGGLYRTLWSTRVSNGGG